VTLAVTAVAPQPRSEPAMHDDIWNDDDSWWHQQDLEMQQYEEELRRLEELGDQAHDRIKENDDAE
jgi:hypothetical protein